MAFSIVANLTSHYSVKKLKISKIEPAKLLEPLFVVLLAVLFSFIFDAGLYEQNLKVIIPAIIAASAVVIAHVEKNQIKFSKYYLAAIASSFFYAMELVTSRLVLDHYSPLTFYFVRCSGILVLSWIILRPKMSKIDKTSAWLVLITGATWVAQRTIVYYGFVELGVIFTTLLIMIAPVLIYLFAWLFLKEKLKLKNIVTSIIIILCILYVLLF
jgi:drug/metabolite transporter (DMT)-like permease